MLEERLFNCVIRSTKFQGILIFSLLVVQLSTLNMYLNISYILNLNQTNFQKKFLFKDQENNVNNNNEFL